MSAAENRKLAEDLFARLSAGDVPGALATLADDATWLAAGRRELLPAAGTYNKERLGRLFNAVLSAVREYLDTQHAHAAWYQCEERGRSS